MAKVFSGFPGKAPETGNAIFTEDFPPESAPLETPSVADDPPVDIDIPPTVNLETGLPMIPVEEALSQSPFGDEEAEDFPGKAPEDILDLLF